MLLVIVENRLAGTIRSFRSWFAAIVSGSCRPEVWPDVRIPSTGRPIAAYRKRGSLLRIVFLQSRHVKTVCSCFVVLDRSCGLEAKARREYLHSVRAPQQSPRATHSPDGCLLDSGLRAVSLSLICIGRVVYCGTERLLECGGVPLITLVNVTALLLRSNSLHGNHGLRNNM